MIDYARCMTHDAWCIMHIAWFMMHDAYCLVHDAWCILLGSWCMIHDAWWILHDASCMMDDAWYMIQCALYIMCDAWCVMHDARCVIHDIWCKAVKAAFQNIQEQEDQYHFDILQKINVFTPSLIVEVDLIPLVWIRMDVSSPFWREWSSSVLLCWETCQARNQPWPFKTGVWKGVYPQVIWSST